MLVHGLRLLVALVTFSAGVAASSLLGFKSKPDCRRVTYTAYAPVQVGPLADVPPPPPPLPRTECSMRGGPGVISGGSLDGVALSKPAPDYPSEAKAAGVRGTVVVKVWVAGDGGVTSVEALSGPGALRDAAEDAAFAARFRPSRLSGEPATVSGTLTYKFGLR